MAGLLTRLAPIAHRFALRVFAVTPNAVRRWVVRSTTPNYVVGVVAVLRHDQDVLLLDQRHDPADWSLPGGLLKRGETPYDGLLRELAEELDLVVALPAHPRRTLVWPAERRVDLVFEVRVAERPPIRVDDREVRRAQWRPVDAPVTNTVTAALLSAVRTPDG